MEDKLAKLRVVYKGVYRVASYKLLPKIILLEAYFTMRNDIGKSCPQCCCNAELLTRRRLRMPGGDIAQLPVKTRHSVYRRLAPSPPSCARLSETASILGAWRRLYVASPLAEGVDSGAARCKRVDPAEALDVERVLWGSRATIGLHQAKDYDCDRFGTSLGTHRIKDYLRAVVPATADRIFEIILGTSCQSITWIHGDRAIDLGVATKLEAPGVDVFGPEASRRVTQ